MKLCPLWAVALYIQVTIYYMNYSLMEKVKLSFIGLVWFMVFNATFSNISLISWLLVLLVEETGVCGENHRHLIVFRNVQKYIHHSNRFEWYEIIPCTQDAIIYLHSIPLSSPPPPPPPPPPLLLFIKYIHVYIYYIM